MSDLISKLDDRHLLIAWAQIQACVRSPADERSDMEYQAQIDQVVRALERRGIIPSLRPISTNVWERDGKFGVTVRGFSEPVRLKTFAIPAAPNRDHLFDTFEEAAQFLSDHAEGSK